MRKTIYQIGMLAVAALAFASCAKEIETDKVQDEGYTHVATVTVGKAGTKTAVTEGATSASYTWTEGDDAYLHVYENGTAGTITNVEYSSDYTSVTLTVSFTGTPTAPYTYTARYFTEESGSHSPLVQAEQNPKADNFDPAADIMISREITSNTRKSTLQFTMGRVVTVNKMTLTGLAEGEKVSKVEFTLSKSVVAYYVPGTGNYSNAGTKLTMKYDTAPLTVPASGEVPVYFIAAPVENAAIKSVVVTTDVNVYTKSDALDPNPFDGKTITFAVGTMKRFNVSMAGYGSPIPTGVKYFKVTSPDQIADGGEYLIVSSKTGGSPLVAMGAYNSDKKYYDYVEVVKETDAVNNRDYIEISSEAVIPVTLEDAGSSQFYVVDSEDNYLYYPGSNNVVHRGNKSETDSFKWTVETTGITNVATTDRQIQYNRASPRFACYSGGQTGIILYAKEGSVVVLEDPQITFGVTEPINVAWDNKDSFVAPTLTKPSGLTATYSSSEESVATVEASTGAITFVGNGTTVITATTPKTSTYKADEASYTIVVSGAPVAKGEGPENPFTVAEALDIISGLASGAENKTQEYYIAGIVSVVTSYNGTYHSLTYNITADGSTTSDFITVYSGKGLNGANFSSTSDLTAGDELIVKGCLMKYNTTPQIYQNSQIVSRVEARYFTASLSANTILYTGGNSITLSIGANVDWTASINNGASLKIGEAADAASVSGSSDTNVTVVIPENTSGATYTISFTTTSTKVSAPANLTITQSDNQVATVKKYVKVTSGTIGGEYLIVRESSSYIFDGSLVNPDSADNYQVATDLSSLDYNTWKDYAVTIESYSTGYSILTASGKYIGRNANSNGIDANTTLGANYVNTISFANNGTVTILGNGGRKFNFNSGSGKFRYFASSNSTEIYLYQLQDVTE